MSRPTAIVYVDGFNLYRQKLEHILQKLGLIHKWVQDLLAESSIMRSRSHFRMKFFSEN